MLNIRTNPLSFAWVKNVYSLCVEGVVNSAQSYTGSLKASLQAIQIGVQPTFSTNTLDSFTPGLYTANFYRLPDTDYYLSTLSTAPTIKKNKKK